MHGVVAVGALACLPWMSPAFSANSPELDEVLVTTRRASESARTVPLAIGVVAGNSIGTGGVDGMQSLAQSTPGLGFESMWGGSNSAPVLRGQSQPSTAGDNVGVFVDDVYQSGHFDVDVDPLDMERIEVVRGPQSALFGRSTFAGAIRYVPRTPTSTVERSLRLDFGNDALRSAQGIWSGPLADTSWLARLALRHRQSAGAFKNGASGETLGGYRHDTVALTVMNDAAGPRELQATFMLRLSSNSDGAPASSTLDASSYNCGGRDPNSGLWSYFCGAIPVGQPVAVTTGLPDSKSHSTDFEIKLQRRYGPIDVHLTLSYFRNALTAIRDFDDSLSGWQLGVCTVGISCGPGALTNRIARTIASNVISAATPSSDEWAQELRLSNDTLATLHWLAGVSAFTTHDVDSSRLGADRGNLLPNERLTALVPANPQFVGPISLFNSALVADSRHQQLLQNDDRYTRQGVAAFGAMDLAASARSRARLEMRLSREQQAIDDRLSNFQPGFGTAIPAGSVTNLTPRASLDYQPNTQWYGYVSLAEGSRSGGVNPVPGLSTDEQYFKPEYNWTTELSARYRDEGFVRGLQLTVYNINWHDTQILGLATTPGVASLVTHNTGGIRTVGAEAQLQWQVSTQLAGEFSLSWTRPKFVSGSDDPGSRAFCGLTVSPFTSSFCQYGPPRAASSSSIALVTYLDGRAPGRTAQTSWNFHLNGQPRLAIGDWRASWSANLSHQGNVYERTIDGAYYGARTLLGAQLQLRRGDWLLAVWGANLTNTQYVRAAASRGNVYFPTTPRPLDLLYGDGRRIGVTATFQR